MGSNWKLLLPRWDNCLELGAKLTEQNLESKLATQVIQMFGEDIDSGVWCDLPSVGNSCRTWQRCWNYMIWHQQHESSGAASPNEQSMNSTAMLCDCWTDLVAAFYLSKRQGIRGPHRDYFSFPTRPPWYSSPNWEGTLLMSLAFAVWSRLPG